VSPGFKSTEFWFAALAGFAGAALVFLGVERGHDTYVVVGAAQQALVAVGYSLGRSKTKAPRPYLPPSGRL